jgi:ribonucleoside-diphosphate reductase alpha chain
MREVVGMAGRTSVGQAEKALVERYFTRPDTHPYDMVSWVFRDARILNYRDNTVVFEQRGVEVPEFWSINATNILAQKYFRGKLGTPERESSLKTVVDRIVNTICQWGMEEGYFASPQEARAFSDELKFLLVTQRAAFNSPVWFNIGVPGTPQQSSACFILSVEDSMSSILNWYVEEGIIFKGGSGAGVNLSKIRSSKESLSGGGTASGPVSFMRGADASAGTIKSGGKTRRAAKMVILDIDHPDIEEFIWCKAIEERKARVLAEAGFDMGVDGKDSYSLQYQNANNSVRVTDEFMRAVEEDREWHLTARTTGEVLKTVRARDLFRQIAEAAWECADPGIQFDTTINRWHTCPNSGRITASNPCSEYMHLDNSACNLASINLLKYLGEDGSFDVDAFTHTVKVLFIAQDILISRSDFPTERIARNARAFREIGLGYANLGALLMARGLPYDSDAGRALAATITALMTGQAYLTSTELAERLGPFSGFADNKEPMLRVLSMHKEALGAVDGSLVEHSLFDAARRVWEEATARAGVHGVRNSQATVIAPTGTIGLLMDCDTTGIEPDLSLVKVKRLVGGGTMSLVNQTVERALFALGYDRVQVKDVMDYVLEHGSIVGAPHIRKEHYAVFACSMGDNVIHYMGHVKMMAAVQPFLSGSISKTVNLPRDITIEQIEDLYLQAWKMGLKSIAIYRDGSKVGQPLAAVSKEKDEKKAEQQRSGDGGDLAPYRRRLPRTRKARTFAFSVAGCEGYVTVGEYDDGSPGEVFIKVAKQGSTLAGIIDAFAIAVSLGLQHGVPLETFVSKYTNMRFEPAGMTNDPEIRIATSLIDYIFRRLAVDYLDPDTRRRLGIATTFERLQEPLPLGSEGHVAEQPVASGPEPEVKSRKANGSGTGDAPLCLMCGIAMQPSGSCYVCTSCGTSSGCS